MKPCYLNLSPEEIEQRAEKLYSILKSCRLCPKNCKVNRLQGEKGFCQLEEKPVVSSFAPHFGEESVLVGSHGSGTIFFTSCNLSCVYCQNYEISQLRSGQEISFQDLARIMINLQETGCHNINLVTPTVQIAAIIEALPIAINKGLILPLVYNTNAYDSVQTLKLLDGIIDIYMPDTKYSDNNLSLKYSGAPDYFEIMKNALKEMHQQVGDLVVNGKGIAVKGLLVRHLILPNDLAGSEKIFKFISQAISKNTFLNIMGQYYPAWKSLDYPELSRRIKNQEYQKAVSLARKFGLKNLLLC